MHEDGEEKNGEKILLLQSTINSLYRPVMS